MVIVSYANATRHNHHHPPPHLPSRRRGTILVWGKTAMPGAPGLLADRFLCDAPAAADLASNAVYHVNIVNHFAALCSTLVFPLVGATSKPTRRLAYATPRHRIFIDTRHECSPANYELAVLTRSSHAADREFHHGCRCSSSCSARRRRVSPGWVAEQEGDVLVAEDAVIDSAVSQGDDPVGELRRWSVDSQMGGSPRGTF
jgi:hypothetical protein